MTATDGSLRSCGGRGRGSGSINHLRLRISLEHARTMNSGGPRIISSNDTVTAPASMAHPCVSVSSCADICIISNYPYQISDRLVGPNGLDHFTRPERAESQYKRPVSHKLRRRRGQRPVYRIFQDMFSWKEGGVSALGFGVYGLTSIFAPSEKNSDVGKRERRGEEEKKQRTGEPSLNGLAQLTPLDYTIRCPLLH